MIMTDSKPKIYFSHDVVTKSSFKQTIYEEDSEYVLNGGPVEIIEYLKLNTKSLIWTRHGTYHCDFGPARINYIGDTVDEVFFYMNGHLLKYDVWVELMKPSIEIQVELKLLGYDKLARDPIKYTYHDF